MKGSDSVDDTVATSFGIKGTSDINNQPPPKQSFGYWQHDTFLGVFGGTGVSSARHSGNIFLFVFVAYFL